MAQASTMILRLLLRITRIVGLIFDVRVLALVLVTARGLDIAIHLF
jgi:hypothetical protein